MVMNWPRVARGIGAGWEAPLSLFFVLEKHVFAPAVQLVTSKPSDVET